MIKNFPFRKSLVATVAIVASGAAAGILTGLHSTLWLIVAGLVGLFAWGSARFLAKRFVAVGFAVSTVSASAAITSSEHWPYFLTGLMLVVGYGIMMVISLQRHFGDSGKAGVS